MGTPDRNTAPAVVPLDPPVGAARKLIVDRLAEIGKNLKWLSLECGKNHAYFHGFVKRGVPTRLPEQIRRRAARALEMDEEKLTSATYADDAEAESRERAPEPVPYLNDEPYRLVVTKGRIEGHFKLPIGAPEFDDLIRSLNLLRKPIG